MYHTEYLYKKLNVQPIKKLFKKVSIICIIINNLMLSIEHSYIQDNYLILLYH